MASSEAQAVIHELIRKAKEEHPGMSRSQLIEELAALMSHAKGQI